MRIEWICKKNAGRVVLFFNGWGMDGRCIAHLSSESDVVNVYDYRELAGTCPFRQEDYQEIRLVAWSMGVWAAANVLPRWNLRPQSCVALNGTEHPVDDYCGIPVKIYELTEKGMDERGREKFFSRMLADPDQRMRFLENRPQRELAEQCEELGCIRRQAAGLQNSIRWDRIYISEKDVIFPVANQQNAWAGRAGIQLLKGGHYPFYEFRNWEEIIFGTHGR